MGVAYVLLQESRAVVAELCYDLQGHWQFHSVATLSQAGFLGYVPGRSS